jgi:hypothetical protein
MKITCDSVDSHVKINAKTIGTMGDARQIIHYTIARPGRRLMGE